MNTMAPRVFIGLLRSNRETMFNEILYDSPTLLSAKLAMGILRRRNGDWDYEDGDICEIWSDGDCVAHYEDSFCDTKEPDDGGEWVDN